MSLGILKTLVKLKKTALQSLQILALFRQFFYPKRGAIIMQSLEALCHYIVLAEYLNERVVTNLRLQKLLYFVQAGSLTRFSEPCFAEEMQAWKLGPVVPEAYRKHSFYGYMPIAPLLISDKNTLIFKPHIRTMIDKVLDDGKGFSTNQLVEITHRQKPWLDAYAKGERGFSNVITPSAIKEFFLARQQTA